MAKNAEAGGGRDGHPLRHGWPQGVWQLPATSASSQAVAPYGRP